uniref:MARVEL domain-containing protein n=1 Tax=Acrobeloides nanus TaxID=290746 RepID=A0A914D7R5_9BILA
MTEESNYKCLCNLHVRKGASVIAIIEIILAILAIVYYAFFNVGLSWWFWLFYEITQIIVCLLVISADRSDHAWLYLPYLIITALGLIGFGIYAFFCIYCVIRLPGHIRDDFDNAKDARDYYNNAFIGTIIGILVNAYFWTVVFRAFKYMRNAFEGRCENKDEGPIDIGEDANSSSYLKEKLTTIIKRVIYISIAFTALLIFNIS